MLPTFSSDPGTTKTIVRTAENHLRGQLEPQLGCLVGAQWRKALKLATRTWGCYRQNLHAIVARRVQ
eukprot:1041149-Amphidinium_carterae.1